MARVKTFKPGGLHVETYRHLTPSSPWEHLPIPSVAVVSAVQYPGAQAEWKVTLGQRVEEEQLLADGLRADDVSLHAPIPGIVEAFHEIQLASGERSQTVVIRLDGTFQKTGKPAQRREWKTLSSDQLIQIIGEQGVPLLASTLDKPFRFTSAGSEVKTLVINAVQPEPYQTLGLHIVEDKFDEILEAIRILERAFAVSRTFFAADPENPAAWKRRFVPRLTGIQVFLTQLKYPQAQRKVLLKTLGLSDQPQGTLLVVEPGTLLAVYQAVVLNHAYVEKPVVVTGDAVTNPGVYRVRLGTPLAELIRAAGGMKPNALVVHGGPFRGNAVTDLASPVMKSTQSILVLDPKHRRESVELPCIHCGACANVCPAGIRPHHLFRALAQSDTADALNEGLNSCVQCGLCAFVCPSRIPLAETFAAAQGDSLA